MGKDVNDPAAKCPLKTALEAEVMGVSNTDPQPQRLPVQGATVSVSGPSKQKAGPTAHNGTRGYRGLTPGNYTVSINLEGDLAERYEGDPASQSKDVKPCANEHYYFEIPYVWVEYKVHDGKNHPLPNVPYVLKHNKAGVAPAAWKKLDEGNTKPDGRLYRKPTPKGDYQLVIKALSDPRWSAAEAVVDEAIEMSATVAGFDPGAAGEFLILDPYKLGHAIETISAKVKRTDAGDRLTASWTPGEKRLKGALESSKVVFRAKVGPAEVLSSPLPLVVKEKLTLRDQDGAKLDATLKLHLSGGGIADAAVSGGAAEPKLPWGQTVARVEFVAGKMARVKMEAGGPAHAFLYPP